MLTILHIIITYLAHNLFKLAKVLCFLNFSLIMSHKTYKSPRPPHPTLFPFRTNFVIISKQNLGRAIFSVLARTTMCVEFMCAMLILNVVLVVGELRLKSPTYLCSIYRVAPNQILHAMTSIILVHASPLFQGLCYRVPRGFRVEGSPFLLEIPKSRHLRKFLFYQQQSHISIQNLKSSPCNFIPNI